MKRWLTFTLLFFALPVSPVQSVRVTGHVRFEGRAPGVSVPTIVYAEALDGAPVRPGQFKMSQTNKTFVPHVLAIPVGSTVSFPNDDLIFHNVFSLSRPNPFDLGLYRAGATKDQRFTAAAMYRVFCNIHPQMSAIILVLPTANIVEADNNGNYRLDLPPGRYRITAWSERAQPSSIEVAAGGAQTAPELTLDESRFVSLEHKNKFGQDYPKSAYETKKN